MWSDIAAHSPLIPTQLIDGFETSGTTIDDLDEVIITVCHDGQDHLHLVTYLGFRGHLASHLDTRFGICYLRDRLLELGIDSSPTGIVRLLVDGELVRHSSSFRLDISECRGILRHWQGLAIELEDGVVSLSVPIFLIALHKGIDCIHHIHWVIFPLLGALRHEEPTLHLLDGLLFADSRRC